MPSKVIIVGAGPAGLFSAYLLLRKGFAVELYERTGGAGKKFLVAGKSGLNLTHNEDLKVFASRYGKDEELFLELIKEFTPEDLREFCESLGAKTFVGSSGRVFPKEMKAAKILASWRAKLEEHPAFSFYPKHRLIQISEDGELLFDTPQGEKTSKAGHTVLTLGGASWKKTGSDGSWKEALEKIGVTVAPFRPMNCGFERPWSKKFLEMAERAPLKNIALRTGQDEARGEAMITSFGIEGGAVYALSAQIRDRIEQEGKAALIVDLKPDLSQERVLKKLEEKRTKDSMSNHLRKSLGLGKTERALLNELARKEEFQDPSMLATRIKELRLELYAPRPIDEAISTSGGVLFEDLDKDLRHKNKRFLYFAGEMLDFEAPTGGYLLQACFSSAFRVANAIYDEAN